MAHENINIRFIGKTETHRCDLPKRGPFWNRNPLCAEGNIIQCQTCNRKWRWTWFGYSGMWDWEFFMTDEELLEAIDRMDRV